MGDTKLTITPNSTGEMVVEECLKKYNVSFDPLTNFVYNSTQVGVFASLSDPDGNDFMMLLMLETMILLLRERSLLLRFRRDHAVLPNEMILRGINSDMVKTTGTPAKKSRQDGSSPTSTQPDICVYMD